MHLFLLGELCVFLTYGLKKVCVLFSLMCEFILVYVCFYTSLALQNAEKCEFGGWMFFGSHIDLDWRKSGKLTFKHERS